MLPRALRLLPKQESLSRNLNCISRKMAVRVGSEESYNDAVATLHLHLVSDPAVVKPRLNGKKLDLMRSFLSRLELSDNPKGIKIIHISGTKGKGSTCAFCESILGKHGYKTGMFTSPHMNEVRERIRVNGKPLSKEMFSRYFWEVYAKFKQTATTDELNAEGGLPAYFNFTVLMSLYVFVKEKVDVGIFEVGVGGQNDATNFFVQPAVCGVTSLGYDHLSILGDTLGEIAWHKAGIFKRGCPAITLNQMDYKRGEIFQRLEQVEAVSIFGRVWNLMWRLLWPVSAVSARLRESWKSVFAKPPMQVILERAVERQAPLYVAAPLSEDVRQNVQLGISGNQQHRNAALAIQMCKMIRDNRDEELRLAAPTKALTVANIPLLETSEDDLDSATLEGLKSCYWPGRTEIVRHESVTYYLDGAHTEESIQHCVDWFTMNAEKEKAEEESKNGKVVRILVFSLTKNRNPGNLLRHLTGCGFDEAVFTPHLRSTVNSGTLMDHFDVHLSSKTLKQVPLENRDTWDLLTCRNISSHTFSCILQALAWVTQGRDPLVKVADPSAVLPRVPQHYQDATRVQVLVTGSLLLVGPVLGILKPGMND